jgi:hypothetical protein
VFKRFTYTLQNLWDNFWHWNYENVCRFWI